MAGMRPTRDDIVDSQGTQRGDFAPHGPVPQAPLSQPLGVILFCKRKRQKGKPTPKSSDLPGVDDRATVDELEKRVQGRIYRVYACEGGSKAGWEFFSVLEFGDLQAWNLFEQDLEQNGFSDRFEWDIRAFGRRLT